MAAMGCVKDAIKNREEIKHLPMGRQGHTVHVFTFVDKVYGDAPLEGYKPGAKPVLANPPWTLLAPTPSKKGRGKPRGN